MSKKYARRYLCDVLRDMRNCCKTGDYSSLPSLIEEAQLQGNRLEADLNKAEDKAWKLRTKVKKLKEKAEDA